MVHDMRRDSKLKEMSILHTIQTISMLIAHMSSFLRGDILTIFSPQMRVTSKIKESGKCAQNLLNGKFSLDLVVNICLQTWWKKTWEKEWSVERSTNEKPWFFQVMLREAKNKILVSGEIKFHLFSWFEFVLFAKMIMCGIWTPEL